MPAIDTVPVPLIDIVDSTWLAARPAVVAALVAEPPNWTRWWPGLVLRVDELRGSKGVRWFVDALDSARDLGLAGTAEVWLEPMHEGVVAHFFLRLDPAPDRSVPFRRRERIIRTVRRQTKDAFWALADQLDPGRVDRHTSTGHASAG